MSLKPLLRRVEDSIAFPIRKHHSKGYPERDIDEIVQEEINHMTPYELLSEISYALECMMEETEKDT